MAVEMTDWTEMIDEGFIELVGPVSYRKISDSVYGFRFASQGKHRNRSGVVHGGMLMTFADRGMGTTAREYTGRPQRTVQFDMRFIRPVEINETVEMTCKVLQATRRLVFMSAELHVQQQLVASASGLFRIR